MLIPIFCAITMVYPVVCTGQSNSSSKDSKEHLTADQLMLYEVKFNNNLTSKDKSVTPVTSVDKNQTTGSLNKDRILLSKELAALLLTLNKEVSDPNKACPGQTMLVKDESNLFGAYFPGLLNQKIL